MTFLNGALAFGAIAAAIPIILHILNRSKFRQVEWGAMHLLESVVKVNHKRFQFEQWILLAIRCAIPVLLAMCLARPVLTGSRILTGDAPVSMVVLLDTSYSMEATTTKTEHFDQAIDAACAIIEATTRGSEVTVIQTGGAPSPVFDEPVFDSSAVARRVRSLQAGYGASDMQKSLDMGLATLAGMTHGRRELIVISDFQPADWNGSGNVAETIRQQVDAMSLKPELSLLQIGKPVLGNVSIESLSFSNRPLGVDQQLAVRANLRNHSDAARDNARVVLKIDGEEQSVSQVSLAGSSSSQVLFPCTFKTPGSHVVEVELIADDPLQTDNKFAAAMTIWDQINVLLVDGDPSSRPLMSETDYLSVALTPYSFGRMKLSDLVKTQTVHATKFKTENLGDYRVVVLANVPLLKSNESAALRDYVRDGGAVLVAAGNRIQTKWYNEQLFAQERFLPAEFGVPRGKIDDNGTSSRIVAQHFDHPALQFFNEPANGDLSTAEIRQWYELRLPANQAMIMTSLSDENSKSEQQSTGPLVLARLDNGDPLLVEQSFGDGSVMQLATSADADWSDLPMRPFYVPLMQQLVTTMAAQLNPPRNIRTGEPAVAILRSATEDASSNNAHTMSVVVPDGSRRTIRSTAQGNQQMVRFDETRRPGVYTMLSPDADTIHFVASTSREESNLETLDGPELTNLAETMGASVVASEADYLEQDRLRRNGREIWKYVLIALLAMMFLELVLQQRFSRVRT